MRMLCIENFEYYVRKHAILLFFAFIISIVFAFLSCPVFFNSLKIGVIENIPILYRSGSGLFCHLVGVHVICSRLGRIRAVPVFGQFCGLSRSLRVFKFSIFGAPAEKTLFTLGVVGRRAFSGHW